MLGVAINKYCPRSGKAVEADSLTTYRGYTVGFCNPGCRDDFASNVEANPDDSKYFDVLIKEAVVQGTETNLAESNESRT